MEEWLAEESEQPAVLVVGDGHVTASLVEELSGYPALAVATDDPVVVRTGRAGDETTVVEGDPTATETLRAAEAGSATLGVVTLADDGRSMLAARLLRARFDVETVISTVEDPTVDRTADVETVCVSETVAERVSRLLDDRHSLTT